MVWAILPFYGYIVIERRNQFIIGVTWVVNYIRVNVSHLMSMKEGLRFQFTTMRSLSEWIIDVGAHPYHDKEVVQAKGKGQFRPLYEIWRTPQVLQLEEC